MPEGRDHGTTDGRPGVPIGPVIAAVAARPGLWMVALRQALRLAPPRWWLKWPPLPAPDPALWRFRVQTAYGGSGEAVPTKEDVRSYLRWCRSQYLR